MCSHLQEKLQCKLGETSADGEFTIEFVECLASCGTAPVVMVDDVLHENVKPERVDQWLHDTFLILNNTLWLHLKYACF